MKIIFTVFLKYLIGAHWTHKLEKLDYFILARYGEKDTRK